MFFSCKEDSVLKIGLIADLNSEKSQLGTTGRNGVILAIDEINKLGGINGQQVELISISHDGEKDKAYSAVKDLVSRGCKLIIGPYKSSMAQSVQVAALNEEVLVISPTVTSSKFAGKDDNFFRLMPIASDQGESLYSAVKFKGNKNIALIMDESNSEYGDDVIKGFYKASEGSDIKISEIVFNGYFEIDILTNYIASGDYDGLIFVTNSIDASNIVKFYDKTNSVPNIYGSLWVKATNIIEYSGHSLDGMVITDSFENDVPNKKEMDFFREYYQKHSSIPNTSSKYSYEAIYLYKLVIEGNDEYTLKDIKSAIINLETINGISEDYKFDNTGDDIRDLALYEIMDGEYHLFDVLK